MKKLWMVAAGWLLATSLAFAQININTASKDDLDGLKGIGPTKAQAIVDYRKKNGPFKSVDDLQNVPGIGPATLKDLRSDVVVSGASRPVAALPAPAARNTAPSEPKPVPASPAIPKSEKPAPAKPATATVPQAESAKSSAPAPATPAKPAMPTMANYAGNARQAGWRGQVGGICSTSCPGASGPARPTGTSCRLLMAGV